MPPVPRATSRVPVGPGPRGIIEILASASDARLGGEDFVEVMMEHCGKSILEEDWVDLSRSADLAAKLRFACERAKRALSSADRASVVVAGVGPSRWRMRSSDAALALVMEERWAHAMLDDEGGELEWLTGGVLKLSVLANPLRILTAVPSGAGSSATADSLRPPGCATAQRRRRRARRKAFRDALRSPVSR